MCPGPERDGVTELRSPYAYEKANAFDLPLSVTTVRYIVAGRLPRSGTVTVQTVIDGQLVGATVPPKYASMEPFLLKNPEPRTTTR